MYRVHRWSFIVPFLLLLFSTCAKESPSPAPPLRRDVTLLDVRIALKTGSHPDVLADESSRDVMLGDTVWVYPVVRLLVGEQQKETVYLANTQRIGAIGRDLDTAKSGWHTTGKLYVWSKLKSDITLNWYQVKPTQAELRAGQPVQFLRVPLSLSGWYQELTGPTGCRRLIVEASYGSQVVGSGSVATEETVRRIPCISFRPDSTSIGWTLPLIGNVPFRPGSAVSQTAAFISYDSPSLIAAALNRLGYSFPDSVTSKDIEATGKTVFQGYVRFGKLCDTAGQRVVLNPERDLEPGDVAVMAERSEYLLVAASPARSRFSFGGIPAGLPVITTGNGFARIRPFWTVLWSWERLLGKVKLKILRFPARELRTERIRSKAQSSRRK